MGGNRHGAGELVKADGEVRTLLQVHWSGQSGHPGEDRELQGGQAGQLHHHQGEDCLRIYILYATFLKQIVNINEQKRYSKPCHSPVVDE